MRRAAFWIATIALLALVAYLSLAATVHRTFKFKLRFWAGKEQGEIVRLEKGFLIRPCHKDSVSEAGACRDGRVYQPIILCDDLTLDFTDYNISDWKDVHGFCPTPGLWIAPAEALFELTNLYDSEVRADGCTEEVMRRIRERRGRLLESIPAPIQSSSKGYRCPDGKSESQCLEYFENLWETWGGRESLQELINDGTCARVVEREKDQKVWFLECQRLPGR